jgi:hypothetical protein
MATPLLLAAMFAAFPVADDYADQTDTFGDPIFVEEQVRTSADASAEPSSRAFDELVPDAAPTRCAASGARRGASRLLPARFVITTNFAFDLANSAATTRSEVVGTRRRDVVTQRWAVGAVLRWQSAPSRCAERGAP